MNKYDKYEKIRRLCIIIGSAMLVCGCFMMLTRGNPLDEVIGYVGVTNGSGIIEVPGYKYSYNSDDEQSLTENFTVIEDAVNIPEIDYYPDDENCNIAVSYTEEYVGKPLYTVYNDSLECIIDSKSSLEMSGESGEKYYIEVSVDWGKKDRSVTVKYYFVINIK